MSYVMVFYFMVIVSWPFVESKAMTGSSLPVQEEMSVQELVTYFWIRTLVEILVASARSQARLLVLPLMTITKSLTAGYVA